MSENGDFLQGASLTSDTFSSESMDLGKEVVGKVGAAMEHEEVPPFWLKEIFNASYNDYGPINHLIDQYNSATTNVSFQIAVMETCIAFVYDGLSDDRWMDVNLFWKLLRETKLFENPLLWKELIVFIEGKLPFIDVYSDVVMLVINEEYAQKWWPLITEEALKSKSYQFLDIMFKVHEFMPNRIPMDYLISYMDELKKK